MQNIQTAFQDGCDTIAAGCTTYGSTPASNSPKDIVTSIKDIYTNRYNAGVNATKVGTATAENVLSGKTFTNSSTVGASGTMINKSSGYSTIASNKMGWDSSNHFWCYIPENAYYSTAYWLQFRNSDVASKIGLTAAKIVKGNTILGISGTATASKSSLTGTKTGTLPANNSLSVTINFSPAFSSKPSSFTYSCQYTSGVSSGADVYVDYSTTSLTATSAIVKITHKSGTTPSFKMTWTAQA